MNINLLYAFLKWNINHTPDAIGNCAAYLLQTLNQSHAALTTLVNQTKPQIDHLCLKPATGLALKETRL